MHTMGADMSLTFRAYCVLHFGGNLQGQVCCSAPSSPCDVTERWVQGCHAVLPDKKILHSLHEHAKCSRSVRLLTIFDRPS